MPVTAESASQDPSAQEKAVMTCEAWIHRSSVLWAEVGSPCCPNPPLPSSHAGQSPAEMREKKGGGGVGVGCGGMEPRDKGTRDPQSIDPTALNPVS